MHDEQDQRASKNADGKHVHSPESGNHPDDALQPGNTSGSGDVEHAQRDAALDQQAAGTKGANAKRQPKGQPPVQRILDRNQELLEGAEPGPEGEEEVSGNRTVSSTDGRRTGDYAND